MGKIYQTLGYISTVILLAFFFYWLFNNFQNQDLSLLKHPSTIASIIIAAILYSFILPISSIAWRYLLLAFGCDRPWSLLTAIMGFTQFAKYIPGNIFQFAGRAVISVKHNIKTSLFLISVGLETLLAVMACVVAVAVLIVTFSVSILNGLNINKTMEIIFYATAVLSIISVVVIFFSPLKLLNFFSQKDNASRQALRVAVLVAIVLYVSNYLIIGLGMWGISLSVLEHASMSYAEITIAFCVAWLAGLIAPGAPAGIGPREAVLVLLIQTDESSQAVLALIVAFRLATIMGDFICFLIGASLLRRRRE